MDISFAMVVLMAHETWFRTIVTRDQGLLRATSNKKDVSKTWQALTGVEKIDDQKIVDRSAVLV